LNREDVTWTESTQESAAVLEWLWDNVAAKVVTELGLDPANPPERLPRIWWITTGPMAFLPLHAAGYYPTTQPQTADKPDDRQLDRLVVSSYIPTLRSLIDARREATPNPTMAVIALTDPPGWIPKQEDDPGPDPLTGAHLDAEFLSTWPRPGATQTATTPTADTGCEGSKPMPPLEGHRATADNALNALAGAGWAHLSCHAQADLTDASQTGFLVYDRLLSLEELAATQITNPQLAFLSACQTSLSTPSLGDEAYHLAGAMLALGYRHAIATLWPAFDRVAAKVTTLFYPQVTTSGQPDPTNAARALNQTIRDLRTTNPEIGANPYTWAPYTHTGA
jgi:hypothetical protein